MEVFLKKSIRFVAYAMVATTVAFLGLLFAQKKTADYTHVISPAGEAYADAPAVPGGVGDGGGGGDGGSPGGGGDDDDDDDDS